MGGYVDWVGGWWEVELGTWVVGGRTGYLGG